MCKPAVINWIYTNPAGRLAVNAAASPTQLFRSRSDWPKHVDNTLPDHCEIRDLAIEDPFYTYCANHPHRRPDRDRIPIGPVTRHGGWQEDPPYAEYPRYARKPSPDTEEVRQHLLSLLDSIFPLRQP